MKPSSPSSGGHTPEIDLVGLYYTLRSQVWIVIGCVVAGFLLGALYLWWAPEIYQGKAIIQVGQSERKVVKIDNVDTENLDSIESMKTMEQNLSNWTLLQRVVRNPKL